MVLFSIVSVAAKVYKRSEWNDISVIAEGGLTRLFDRGNLSGGMRVGRHWVGSRGFRRSVGPWASFYQRVSPKTHLDVRANADYRMHDDEKSRDGWRVAANPGIRYTLDNRATLKASTLKASTHFEAVEARAGHRSSRLFSMTAGFFSGVQQRVLRFRAAAGLPWRGFRSSEEKDRTRPCG